jgi:hypothetical protein
MTALYDDVLEWIYQEQDESDRAEQAAENEPRSQVKLGA